MLQGFLQQSSFSCARHRKASYLHHFLARVHYHLNGALGVEEDDGDSEDDDVENGNDCDVDGDGDGEADWEENYGGPEGEGIAVVQNFKCSSLTLKDL